MKQEILDSCCYTNNNKYSKWYCSFILKILLLIIGCQDKIWRRPGDKGAWSFPLLHLNHLETTTMKNSYTCSILKAVSNL
jgi:hypothetical protein